MKFFKVTFLTLIFFAISVIAQNLSDTLSEVDWIRVESPSKDLSISFPSNPIVDNEDGQYRVYSYKNGVRMNVTFEPKKNYKSEFKRGLSFIKDRKNYEFYTAGDFIVSQYTKKESAEDDFYMSFSLASSNGLYSISVSAKDDKNNEIAKFLYSLLLNGKPLFTQNNKYPTDKMTISITSLKTDEVVLRALRQQDNQQKFFEKATEADKEKSEDTTNYSRGLITLRKPRASYTDSARERRIQGTVKLKATFFADGQIGQIKLIESLDRDLDKEAFKAAKQMKFLPAEVNGKPVDTTKFIQYSFTIY